MRALSYILFSNVFFQFLLIFLFFVALPVNNSLAYEKLGGSSYSTSVTPYIGFLSGKATIDQLDFGSSWKKQEFPMDTLVAGFIYAYKANDTLIFSVDIEKNITSYTGKSSDVEYQYVGGNLYTSYLHMLGETELDMVRLDFGGRLDGTMGKAHFLSDRVAKKSSTKIVPFFLFGYRFEYMHFDFYDMYVDDLRLSSAVQYSGKNSSYEIMTHVPYIGFGFEYLTKNKNFYTIELEVGYVIFSDEEHNEITYKNATASGTGMEARLALSSKHKLSKRTSFGVESSFLARKGDGEQSRSFYAGPDAGTRDTVEHEVGSHQFRFIAKLTYLF